MKETKFIAIPESRMIFLTLIKFWAENEHKLQDWCRENNCVQKGMTVEAADDHAFMMFVLRWA